MVYKIPYNICFVVGIAIKGLQTSFFAINQNIFSTKVFKLKIIVKQD